MNRESRSCQSRRSFLQKVAALGAAPFFLKSGKGMSALSADHGVLSPRVLRHLPKFTSTSGFASKIYVVKGSNDFGALLDAALETIGGLGNTLDNKDVLIVGASSERYRRL